MQHRDAKQRNVGLVTDHKDVQLGRARKRYRRRVELAGEAGDVFFFFLMFRVFFFFLWRSLIDFSHPCIKRETKKKHTVDL